MSKLSERPCEACRADAPKASEEEIQTLMPHLPDWQLVHEDGLDKIKRVYTTKKYAETLRLVNAIAAISEEEGHHPVMLFEFRQLTLWWWSHKIKGLHVNDFVMAAKCDVAYFTCL